MQLPPCSSSPENSTPTGRVDRPGRQRLQDRGDRALDVGGAQAVQPVAPPHQQVGRRRVALVGGHGVDVGVQQQARRAARRSARRRRRGRRPSTSSTDAAPSARSSAPRRCTSGALVPVGIARVERHQLGEPLDQAIRGCHRRGYTMVCGPCRPPPSPSSRSCSPRRGPVATPRPRCRRAPHIAATRTPPAAGHRRPPGRRGLGDRRAVGRVRAALPRRGRAPQRAHRRARALRRQEPLRRHRLRAAERADRPPAAAPRLAAPVRRRLDRHRQPPHRRRRVPLRGQRRRHAVRRHPLRRHRATPATGTPSGKRRSPTPAAATRSSSASRCRCCASRRCRCRTGASRSGASSTRARRPTTGRSTRAAPRPTSRCSDGSTTCATWTRATPSSCGRSCSGAPATAPPTPTRTLDERLVGGRARSGWTRRAHVTNELTLDATLNPDFGQVEADTVVLNLSTFETFFPEKRPFFLEGIDAFATRAAAGLHAAHRAPAGDAGAGADARTLVASPDPTPLYGAAKLVGTIGARTTVGLISALTGPNDVEVERLDGARELRRLDPWTDVQRRARSSASWRANAEVGVLATAANRFETPTAVGALCPATGAPTGPDGRCTNDAYVVSTDGRWRSALGDYAVAWQAVGTTLRERSRRARSPTASPSAPGQRRRRRLAVRRQGGRRALAVERLAAPRRAQTLEFNDVGYLERKNDYQALLRR